MVRQTERDLGYSDLNVVRFQYDLVGETNRKGDNDPKKRATDIIGKLDVGGDKKLSKQEFIAG